MSRDWSPEENARTVDSYFRMLKRELARERVVKSAMYRELAPALDGRTPKAIEYKFENISAVLLRLEYPFVNGLKPAWNYQRQLRDEVIAYLTSHPEFDALVREHADRRPGEPRFDNLLELDEPAPAVEPAGGMVRETASFGPVRINYFERESRNRELGVKGEKLVLDYEVARLEKHGQDRLARKVDWVAQSKGDGLGYDIQSFEVDGRDRLIEVKTTTRGPRAPFYVTARELDCSRAHADSYQIYRVHSFE